MNCLEGLFNDSLITKNSPIEVKERSRLFKFILLIYTVYKKKSFKQVHS